jgi:hypothetical protein
VTFLAPMGLILGVRPPPTGPELFLVFCLHRFTYGYPRCSHFAGVGFFHFRLSNFDFYVVLILAFFFDSAPEWRRAYEPRPFGFGLRMCPAGSYLPAER